MLKIHGTVSESLGLGRSPSLSPEIQKKYRIEINPSKTNIKSPVESPMKIVRKERPRVTPFAR